VLERDREITVQVGVSQYIFRDVCHRIPYSDEVSFCVTDSTVRALLCSSILTCPRTAEEGITRGKQASNGM
jgi:hypothetical protein